MKHIFETKNTSAKNNRKIHITMAIAPATAYLYFFFTTRTTSIAIQITNMTEKNIKKYAVNPII